ncbi:MAG: M20/M25/M40 family metallo-hydrolase [Candidatus Moraniibacteriota bacterium]
MEKLILDLLKIESYSGNEKKVADFIISKLKGFEIECQLVAKNRFNIIAKKGNSKIWLLAHMDTVKSWIEPRIEGNKIYGRGAVDNKGNIASAIEVGKRLENINLCFTVGEEYDFIGAKSARKIIKNDLVVVMEPTNFEIYSGQRGMIEFEISTKGKQGHSAYANSKNNAIQKIANIIVSFERKKWTAFNVGKIEGGIAANIVAPVANAIISVRPETTREYNSILRDIKNFKILNNIPPVVNQKIKGKIKKAFTEMAFFENSIVFGAGDFKQAHSDKEYILRKDLKLAPEKIIKLLEKISKNA